jgi:DNA-binding NtrC family response regulator
MTARSVSGRVLVVDDEKNIREGLGKALELDGHRPTLAGDGEQALHALSADEIDLIISDLRMPSLGGGDLLKRVVSAYPTVPVIILTGHGTIESAVQAMRDGAYDFLTKPVNLDRLGLLVKRALSRRQLVLENQDLQEQLDRRSISSQIIAASTSMKQVFEVVQQVAPTRASVLITGESGVGKEVVADTIHTLSPRKDGPFVKVHCAALTESLLESELFGHERGAFTGAVGRRRGRFELADGGTIFLDEIGEISQTIQVKLLRVLQERTFERVGGEETISSDVRVVAATNRDLKEAIEAGDFREDLYYRLNVVNIHVPPLRERASDIPLLATAFLREYAQENDKRLDGFESAALNVLHRYSWPGNIRELRNSIESAVVMAKGDSIGSTDLPPAVRDADDVPLIRVEMGSSLALGEREIIRATLRSQNGNKTRTAQVLGIGRKTLHRKLKDLELE